jgi:hypothetical protein
VCFGDRRRAAEFNVGSGGESQVDGLQREYAARDKSSREPPVHRDGTRGGLSKAPSLQGLAILGIQFDILTDLMAETRAFHSETAWPQRNGGAEFLSASS